MKKIIAMAVAAICLVSATFALDFEVGARGILGYNMALDSDFKTEYMKAKDSKVFDAGFGAYANFALFGGLGIQAEANYIKSSMDFNVQGGSKESEYAIRTLDLAPMVWLNLDLWKLTIGFGAGPNFSIPISTTISSDLGQAKKDDFQMGYIGGADFKFYFTKHLGLVLSGRFIGEFDQRTVKVEAYGKTVDTEIPEVIPKRKTVYGGLGVEWKFF